MKINQEILQKAIEKFGKESQLNMDVEKSAELIKAIAKYRLSPNLQTLADIYDEMADVLIMIDQMKLIFEWGDSLDVDGSYESKSGGLTTTDEFKGLICRLTHLIFYLEGYKGRMHVEQLLFFAWCITEKVQKFANRLDSEKQVQERIDFKLERLKNRL